MITRAGRVVVMDFGLARRRGARGARRTIAGTPAYMAPEQARGDAVDARADVFAAGVVLSEMLSVGGEADLEARQALWRAVRQTPPRVPDGSVGAGAAPVARLRSAGAPGRPPTRSPAHSRRSLSVSLASRRDSPYPGLASFTEQDAEYFFGREVEVEAVWKKLKRPRLLALVGPSGAGKSSFLRAGLLPTLPGTWKAVITTPGSHPFQALAEALVPAFSGDTQALQALLRFEDPETALQLFQRFRTSHEHVLVIVDQFEELFTLNPTEVQDAFARLLGRLVLDADIHVVLSLGTTSSFAATHTSRSPPPLCATSLYSGPLGESGLRRALVQPALACGYRFEDESLVNEMVAGMARERGALPLLAFAASRLWEKRDRERGLLTREAYTEIGGVAGALAQHAEATLGRIGTERIPLVRELFRNLVTSQGTRAVRERGELLSVFASEAGPEGDGSRWRGAGRSHRRAPLDVVRARRRGWREPPADGDHPRVAAQRVAAPRTLADAGCGRGAASRPAAPGGAALAGPRSARRTCSGPARPTAISRSGGNAIPAPDRHRGRVRRALREAADAADAEGSGSSRPRVVRRWRPSPWRRRSSGGAARWPVSTPRPRPSVPRPASSWSSASGSSPRYPPGGPRLHHEEPRAGGYARPPGCLPSAWCSRRRSHGLPASSRGGGGELAIDVDFSPKGEWVGIGRQLQGGGVASQGRAANGPRRLRASAV